MKNIISFLGRNKSPFIKSMLAVLFLFSIRFICHSQVVDSSYAYRLYGSQHLETLTGTKTDSKDSLMSDVENMDLNTIPDYLTYELKIHNLCSRRTINSIEVEEQVAVINSAFQYLNIDRYIDNENINGFFSLAGVPNIGFCYDPDIAEANVSGQFEIDSKILFDLNQISPAPIDKKLINIYVVDLKGDYGGIATSPSSNSTVHGIVVDYRFFGIHELNYPNYNEGKTLVHLLSSFMGLNELWNETVPCADDGINDTPVHNYANFTPGTNYKNISTCEGNPPEMIVNYMDNLPDGLMTMFTSGQSDMLRKLAFSKFGRKNLLTDACTQQSSPRVSQADLKIYPNPNTGNFFLMPSIKMKHVKIQLYDVVGMPVNDVWFPEIDNLAGVALDITHLPNGIYFVEITSKDQLRMLRKIIKQ
ncbi:MAG: T9SS type A sorting domain-containing protein [Saprospiraceae bacterium]|nr:T9SS type A sorting domain-containing protein [Saprospiraceae bacterium]